MAVAIVATTAALAPATTPSGHTKSTNFSHIKKTEARKENASKHYHENNAWPWLAFGRTNSRCFVPKAIEPCL